MKLTTKHSMTFELEAHYVVDITIEPAYQGECFEAWLYRASYGVKMFMFGATSDHVGFTEFCDMVENLAGEYIDRYKYEYEDEEEYEEDEE